MAIFEEFQKIELRVGRILEIENFPKTIKPSYKLKIDFGKEIGIKHSSAQLTKRYSKEDLKGRLIIGITNFPPKNIAGLQSEVLVLGVPDKNHDCVLLRPDDEIELGVRVY